MNRSSLRSNAAALAYLKLIHDKWYRHQDMFGDTHNAALARLVLIGWMDGRLEDFTSLSYGLNISRQQATRRCVSMGKLGWVEYKREGVAFGKVGRVAIKPTDKLVEWATVEIPKRIRFSMPRWQALAALIATTIVPIAVPPTEVAIEVVEVVAVEGWKRSESHML